MPRECVSTINGQKFIDDRGSISCANLFAFDGVKRFYLVENHAPQVVRAWHGHERETKYVFVTHGAAIVAAVALEDIRAQKSAAVVHRFVLSAESPVILRIPAGYANGFRPLTERTQVMFFSTATLEESRNDDWRFPAPIYGHTWEVENR